MDKKISDLRKCISRTAFVSAHTGGSVLETYVRRYTALWAARNRRARVIMFRHGGGQ